MEEDKMYIERQKRHLAHYANLHPELKPSCFQAYCNLVYLERALDYTGEIELLTKAMDEFNELKEKEQ
jgi:hypothetical protein